MINALVVVIALLLLVIVFLILALVEAGNRNRALRGECRAFLADEKLLRERIRELHEEHQEERRRLRARLEPFRAWRPEAPLERVE